MYTDIVLKKERRFITKLLFSLHGHATMSIVIEEWTTGIFGGRFRSQIFYFEHISHANIDIMFIGVRAMVLKSDVDIIRTHGGVIYKCRRQS